MKKKLATIGFRTYLYKGTDIPQSAKGVVVLLDEYGKESYGDTGSETFNYWDEIPLKMRRLLRRNKIKRGYYCKGKLIAEKY